MDRSAEFIKAMNAQEHVIVTGARAFSGARSLDAVLTEFGYARSGRVRWERIGDDSMSLALVPAYDRDTDREVVVAVVGSELYLTTPVLPAVGV